MAIVAPWRCKPPLTFPLDFEAIAHSHREPNAIAGNLPACGMVRLSACQAPWHVSKALEASDPPYGVLRRSWLGNWCWPCLRALSPEFLRIRSLFCRRLGLNRRGFSGLSSHLQLAAPGFFFVLLSGARTVAQGRLTRHRGSVRRRPSLPGSAVESRPAAAVA